MPTKTRNLRPLLVGLLLILTVPLLTSGFVPTASVLGIHLTKHHHHHHVVPPDIDPTPNPVAVAAAPMPTPTPTPTPTHSLTPTPKPTPTPSPTPAPTPAPALKPSVVTVAAAGRYGVSYGDTLAWDSPTALATTLDDAVALGVGWIRMDLSWDHIQPDSSTAYRWSNYDAVIAGAQARHLNVLLVVAYTPAWARPSGCTDSKCHPADPNTYAAFARTAVARYAPMGVHTWELWNEENAVHYWEPAVSVSQYVALVQATVPGMKAIDPTATVISGGLAPKSSTNGDLSQLDYVAAFCGQGGTKVVDGVGIHPYSSVVLPSYVAKWNPWTQIETTAVSYRSILAGCGTPNTKIWLTEYGGSTAGTGAVATTTNYLITGPVRADHVSEELEAAQAADSVRIAKSSTIIAGLFWYTYRDLPGTAQIDGYGLHHVDGTPKLAWAAYKQAIATP